MECDRDESVSRELFGITENIISGKPSLMECYGRFWNMMQSKHYYSYNHLLMGQFPELTLVWTIHARSTRSQFHHPLLRLGIHAKHAIRKVGAHCH